MLLGGCLDINKQTLAYSEVSQKFAFAGEAHVYVFDTRGQVRLDTIIPYCEKIQARYIAEIKETALIETTDQEKYEIAIRKGIVKTFVVNKDTERVASFVSGVDLDPEIWGGVGLTCIEWHPTEANTLAAITMKTNQLEVWKVDCAQMIAILELEKCVA